MTEDPLAQARRHVLEGEQQVAEQLERIERMRTSGDSKQSIASAEVTLVLLRQNLERARERLARATP